MVSDGYVPRWVDVRTDGGIVRAITFTIDHSGSRYAGRLSLDDTADVIARAEGGLGSCAEYLMSTVNHLDEMGIPDRRLHALRDRVQVLLEARSRGVGTA